MTAEVRVRFCPSPTGVPHVGLIRTALFNWAYARHHGGKFIFRIEDTDAKRDSQESYEQLLEAMRWLGLDWDEGVEVGGPHGPYRQSQRSDIYRQVVTQLLDSGAAYESFSSAEEITARHKAAGSDPQLGYDNYDRKLTDEQKAAFRAEGRTPVIRLRMPDEDITFTDLVRGEITFKAGSVPDFVIVRGNGDPLYTLVNPLDDALMEVTHVLRGEDLLSSTPRQIALYQALEKIGIGSGVPEFGHLPYVMGQGNKKLSKRDPESNLFLYRDRGFIKEGLINYLALLGWAIGPDRDVFSIPEFISAFDVADVNPNPARFDVKKAEAINAAQIRLLPHEDLLSYLPQYLGDVLPSTDYDELPVDTRTRLSLAAPLVQTRMQVLSQASDLLRFLFVSADEVSYDPAALKGLGDRAGEVLAAARAALEPIATEYFSAAKTQEALQQALITDLGLKPRFAFGPVRTAMSGRRVSPPLFESLEILGKAQALARLDRFAEFLSASAGGSQV